MAEQLFRKQQVNGSNPFGGSITPICRCRPVPHRHKAPASPQTRTTRRTSSPPHSSRCRCARPTMDCSTPASVVAGVLALSVVSGLVWRWLSRRANGARWFTVAMSLGFIIWVAIAFSLETQLERMVSFSVPLAAIAFGAIALLVPRLFVSILAQRRIVVLAALAVAVVAGAGLANRGDAESGRLELPPRADADHVRTF